MASIIRNAVRLVTHPRLAREYARYQYSALRNGGEAKRQLWENIEVSGFSGFSEYHSCVEHVSEGERNFLTMHEFDDGAIIDVGANLGIVTMLLARRFSERPVHAFEPHPSTVVALRRNCDANQLTNTTVVPAAVAQSDGGEVTFDAHPRHRAKTRIADSGSHITRVPSVSLDSYAVQNELERVALLKVDVEGYERSVFEGTQQLLSEQRIGAVYYEVCPALAEQAGFSPEAPTRMLHEHGYRLYRLRENGTLAPARVDDVNDVQLENWVALQP